MTTSRARRIEWLGGAHSNLARRHVHSLFARYGLAWLTDEQLDEIVRKQAADYRFTQRLNRRNRERLAAKEAK